MPNLFKNIITKNGLTATPIGGGRYLVKLDKRGWHKVVVDRDWNVISASSNIYNGKRKI